MSDPAKSWILAAFMELMGAMHGSPGGPRALVPATASLAMLFAVLEYSCSGELPRKEAPSGS